MRIVRILGLLFAAKGFNGLSISIIAAAMGGSKANGAHHSRARKLYIAVIRLACNEVRAEPSSRPMRTRAIAWFGPATPAADVAKPTPSV
jgi:hypothetical protein